MSVEYRALEIAKTSSIVVSTINMSQGGQRGQPPQWQTNPPYPTINQYYGTSFNIVLGGGGTLNLHVPGGNDGMGWGDGGMGWGMGGGMEEDAYGRYGGAAGATPRPQCQRQPAVSSYTQQQQLSQQQQHQQQHYPPQLPQSQPINSSSQRQGQGQGGLGYPPQRQYQQYHQFHQPYQSRNFPSGYDPNGYGSQPRIDDDDDDALSQASTARCSQMSLHY